MNRKKTRRVTSFKNNLKRMLLTYSLVPAVELMVVCAAIALIAGGFFIADRNIRVNREIAAVVESALNSYDVLLSELAELDGLVDPVMSLTKRQKIVRKLYTVSVDTGYDADLYLLDEQYNVCMSTREGTPDNLAGEMEKRWRILGMLRDHPEKAAFDVNAMGGDKRIYMGRRVEGGGLPGYVIVSIHGKEFTKLLSGYLQKNMIVDGSGWVLSTSSYSFVDAVGRLAAGMKGKRGFFSYEGGSFYGTAVPVRGGKMTILTITDNTDLAGLLLTILVTGLAVLAAVFLIAFASAERMAKKSTADIWSLSEAFQRVTAGRLDAYLDIHSSTEFEQIGEGYNGMLDSLKGQIAANKELAETVAYAQVRQLESQFNSHFLFNTLDNIRFMCKIDADLAEYMTVSLSQLLRYNTSSANETVTVREDLKYIGIYLEIIKIRYGGRLTYRIEVSEEADECAMPKLLLQPLIENSIKYGFGDRERLHVRIEGFLDGRELVFCCHDDGVGIEPEMLRKIRHNMALPKNESSHLGLYNVHRRLYLLYGEKYGLSVESREEEGVSVTVRLPAETEGGKQDAEGSDRGR